GEVIGRRTGGRGRAERVERGPYPDECLAHARNERRTAVIAATDQTIFMGDIQVPEHAVQKLRSVVGVDEVLVADLDIDGKTAVVNGPRIGAGAIRWIVGLEEDGIATGPDQIRRT